MVVQQRAELSVKRFLPMLLLMIMIFILSSQPGDAILLPDIVNIDKACHLLEYTVLGASCLYALHPAAVKLMPITICCLAIVICTAYGITDEVHQMFVPGRDSSAADVAADFLGALLAAGIWWYKFKNRRLLEDLNHANI